MTEPSGSTSAPSPQPPVAVAHRAAAATAGALIRQIRERQGTHLGIVAATLKVPVRKLEALEADRLDEFPNLAFVRALANSVCRVLKTDPAPVLAALPQADSGTAHLAEVTNRHMGGFAEPAARASGAAPRSAAAKMSPAMVWAALALLIAAGLALWWPQEAPRSVILERAAPDSPPPGAVPAEAAVAEAASAPPAAGAAPVNPGPPAAAQQAASAPAAPVAAVTAVAPAPSPARPETRPASAAESATGSGNAPGLTASAPSWVEAVDAQQRVVLSRILSAGEAVVLEGTGPWRVVIGNASATQVRFRGRNVDLVPHTRENVARIELN